MMMQIICIKGRFENYDADNIKGRHKNDNEDNIKGRYTRS